MRTRTALSQLIFDHALRVRLNTASPEKRKASKAGDGDQSVGSRSGATTPDIPESTIESGAATPQPSQPSSSTTLEVETSPPKDADTDEKEQSSLSGSILNLTTVDMQNIGDGVDIQWRKFHRKSFKCSYLSASFHSFVNPSGGSDFLPDVRDSGMEVGSYIFSMSA